MLPIYLRWYILTRYISSVQGSFIYSIHYLNFSMCSNQNASSTLGPSRAFSICSRPVLSVIASEFSCTFPVPLLALGSYVPGSLARSRFPRSRPRDDAWQPTAADLDHFRVLFGWALSHFNPQYFPYDTPVPAIMVLGLSCSIPRPFVFSISLAPQPVRCSHGLHFGSFLSPSVSQAPGLYTICPYTSCNCLILFFHNCLWQNLI